ncbi:MAG: hypothetical protein EZS28_048700, partial [Streblomastix strix]
FENGMKLDDEQDDHSNGYDGQFQLTSSMQQDQTQQFTYVTQIENPISQEIRPKKPVGRSSNSKDFIYETDPAYYVD